MAHYPRKFRVSAVPAPLDQKLLGEGWSLHQRLAITATRGVEAPPLPTDGDPLASWRKVVAPDQLEAFAKRLQWDGLTPEAAAWALEPAGLEPPEAPAWLPLLEALCQVAREAGSVGADPSASGLEQRGEQLPFVHVWRPATSWALTELKQRCHDLQPSLVHIQSTQHCLDEHRRRPKSSAGHSRAVLLCVHFSLLLYEPKMNRVDNRRPTCYPHW